MNSHQREQDDETRFCLAASTGDIWEADLTRGKLTLSAQFKRRLGFNAHEIGDTPESWAKLLHPEDRDFVCEAFIGHLTKRTPYDVEYRKRTKSGDYRWFNARGQATWNESGRATFMAGGVDDVTSPTRDHTAVAKIIPPSSPAASP